MHLYTLLFCPCMLLSSKVELICLLNTESLRLVFLVVFRNKHMFLTVECIMDM